MLSGLLRYRTIMTGAALAAGLALLLAGCGGGGAGEPAAAPSVDTASLSGTVYAPAAVATAQANSGEQTVANCRVRVRTEPSGQQLAWGTTDGNGRYQFRNLPAGTEVTVEADVPGVGPLMTRTRLRDGSCQADVSAETTVAAYCAQYGEGEHAGEVAEECLQYQAQNGYRFGGGNGPNFGSQQDVEQTAGEVLAAAAFQAVEQARQTRSEEDCEQAVRMLQAHLRERHQNRTDWDAETLQQLTQAMQAGSVTVEQAAQAMTRAMNQQCTGEQVREGLRYMWQAQGVDEPARNPEAAEVAAAFSIANAGAQSNLCTRAQLRAFVGELQS